MKENLFDLAFCFYDTYLDDDRISPSLVEKEKVAEVRARVLPKE
jgi:hypothetical protein